ncbi:MAG: ABC transporter permease [Synergistaceae bacterium]|nr:ABC transporter permease [Synergistaceae bacterium]
MLEKVKKFIAPNIRELGILGIIFLIVIFVNIRSRGNFLTPANISDMFTESSILVIMTMGIMMVIITGGIDLSVGAMMALGGMVAVTVLKNNMDTHPLFIILISVAVGLLAGLLNGCFVAYFKILPLIATLGTMNIYRGSTYMVSGGSWVLQQNMSKSFMNVATGKIFGINNMIIIAAAVVAVTYFYMNRYRAGRQIYAVGNSEEAAAVSGINTKRVKLTAYAILGGLSGLGGVLYVCKYAAAQGETAQGIEMSVIAACVLGGVAITGGRGKVFGALLGAILLGILNNALPLLRVSPFWQEAVRGMIILISIIANVIVSRRIMDKALERRTAER